jgi:hypothetical protein
MRVVESARPIDRRASSPLPGILLALGIAAVLAGSAAVEQSADSLAYLTKARAGTGLFHPHHLLFNAAVRMVYLGLAALTGVRDVVVAAQVHNLAFSVIALLAVYLIGLRWLGSQSVGLLGLCWYGSSTGLMVFATQAEVYVPAAGAAAVAALFLLQLVDAPRSRKARVGLVASWVIAVLYHQTSVLLLVPMVVVVIVVRSRDLAKSFAAVAVTAGSLVLGIYWLAFRVTNASSSEVLSLGRYVFSYAFAGGVRWGDVANVSAAGSLRLLESHLWGLSTLVGAEPTILITLALAGAGAAWLAWRFSGRRARLVLCYAVTSAVTYLAFFLWWFPVEKEFAVLTGLPMCLALMAGMAPLVQERRLGRAGFWSAVSGVVLISAVNFVGTYRLELRPRHQSPGQAFHRARFLATFDDGSTLRLTEYKVVTSTRFYFADSVGSVGEINLLERSVHAQRLDAPWMNRTRWDRVIVNVAEIQPWAWYNGRNGFHEPETWLRMLGWVLNLRDEGDGWRSDGWEIVTDDAGNEYLLVTDGDSRWGDPLQLLERLSSSLERGSKSRRAFKKWAVSNSHLAAAGVGLPRSRESRVPD